MIEKELEAAVGMSRKWDAREAGREVARNTIEKLNSPPKFFVLFSTIHYKDNGGLQELLNGVYDVLPKNIPLIGGTIRGFINNFGCFTRGVTGLAVSSKNMDIILGFGKNTKRNPKKAARQCAEMIKRGFKDNKYNNRFLLNLISASELPDIPSLGRTKIVKPGFTSKSIRQLYSFSQYVLQKGTGRDDELIEEMVKHFSDCHMMGCGTIDGGAGFTNYQFFNDKVMTNSVVTLGIATSYDLDVLTTHNMKKTDIKFKITKTSKDGRIIHEINGKPAFTELLNLHGWPKDFLTEDTWLKTTFYFPLGCKYGTHSDEIVPRVIGFTLGESLVTGFRSKDTDSYILTIDGKGLLETIDMNLSSFPSNPEFGLIASCTTRLETMGNKIYQARDRILHYFNDRPFIVFYVGGESTYSPKRKIKYVNMSFNSAIFFNSENSHNQIESV